MEYLPLIVLEEPLNSHQIILGREVIISGHISEQKEHLRCQHLRKKKEKKEDKAQEEGGMDVIPVFGGVVVASVLGGPVVLIGGLKLGMFAAIGGGIMGYTTGKMFSDHG